MPAIPFYLIFAVDPPAAGAGFRISHFSYEADRRGTTTLGAAVKEVLDRDTYPLESVWLCNPSAGVMTDCTVEVLEEVEASSERAGHYAPRHVLAAMARYGVRHREPRSFDDDVYAWGGDLERALPAGRA
jgi:hypothetical protein